MIQIITKSSINYKNYNSNKKIVISAFADYKSFDLYDINIIDLSSNSLWYSKNYNYEELDDKNDLIPISNSIITSNSKILILLPQNSFLHYEYNSVYDKYRKTVPLKSITTKVIDLLSEYIYIDIPLIQYEKGITKIDDEEFESDFYIDSKIGIIKCERSGKVNTIKVSERIVISTLNLFKNITSENFEKRLQLLLDRISFFKKEEEIPDWISGVSFYYDESYMKAIRDCDDKIEKLKLEIISNKAKLDLNMKYKSILYSTGNALSKQINEMLTEIFELDSEFVDVYEEDFNFKFNNVTFLVETKGLNNEVAGKNVSDAYDHLVLYEDDLEKQGKEEETKCLFIVAPERMKNPSERAKIKERQITIAKRNKTLIIETTTFYNIFEDFIKGKISNNEIFDLFNQNVGLLEYSKKEG